MFNVAAIANVQKIINLHFAECVMLHGHVNRDFVWTLAFGQCTIVNYHIVGIAISQFCFMYFNCVTFELWDSYKYSDNCKQCYVLYIVSFKN